MGPGEVLARLPVRRLLEQPLALGVMSDLSQPMGQGSTHDGSARDEFGLRQCEPANGPWIQSRCH